MTVDEARPPYRNEVLLVGRVSMPATRRQLPSGDVVLGVRVIVERDRHARPERAARVDAIDCAAWSRPCQEVIEGCRAGDMVEIVGALRRRFRRTEAGPTSRYEVEVHAARLLATAAESSSREPSAHTSAPTRTPPSTAP
jgi:single-strand DNA-binding protein